MKKPKKSVFQTLLGLTGKLLLTTYYRKFSKLYHHRNWQFGQMSIRESVHSGKCFSVKCPFGQMSIHTSVHSD